jgi:ectonucleotide pyrophosphatase/phosphodiesterase family protein 5
MDGNNDDDDAGVREQIEEIMMSSPISHSKSYSNRLQSFIQYLLIGVGFLAFLSIVFVVTIISNRNQSKSYQLHSNHLHRVVFLFSIDGFRWDYISNFPSITTRNLQMLMKNGVTAEKLISSYPTRTFPNHYTLVTGKYPASHGILNNAMYNKVNGAVFTMNSTETFWWQGGEPIWITVEKFNYSSSVVFWPGSNVELQGMRPTHYQAVYNDTYGDMNKIDLLMSYLDADMKQQQQSAGTNTKTRPNLLYASYFSGVDHAGHAYGPITSQVQASIANIDKVFGYLFSELEKRGINPFKDVNIIVVSDHGMAELNKTCEINVASFINNTDLSNLKLVSVGPFVEITAINRKSGTDSLIDRVYNNLKMHESPHFTVYKPYELPDRLYYNQVFYNYPDRAADLVVSVEDHCWMATSFVPSLHGDHGYDNKYDDMGALFIASGPKIRQSDIPVPAFANINIYPLLAKIMELNDEKMLPEIYFL